MQTLRQQPNLTYNPKRQYLMSWDETQKLTFLTNRTFNKNLPKRKVPEKLQSIEEIFIFSNVTFVHVCVHTLSPTGSSFLPPF